MQKITFALLLSIIANTGFTQINMADSTVQAVSYWSKGDKYDYAVHYQKTQVEGEDTTLKETITYDVEITVLDSAENSFTVQWVYKNCKTDHPQEIYRRLMESTNDFKIIFKINELGAFQEVVNLQDIQQFTRLMISELKEEFSHLPTTEKIAAELEKTFSSKEAVESASILDILQFHTFHGGKYKLGEVLEAKTPGVNIFGGDPLEMDMKVYLDDINEEDNHFTLVTSRKIDKEQLATVTLNYLEKLNPGMGADLPVDVLKNLENENITTCQIHGSGWLLYSIHTGIVQVGKNRNIEERTIELK